MEQVARVISESSYVLNPAILRQMKEIIGTDIVLFSQDGRIFNSTFSSPGIQDELKKVLRAGLDPNDSFTGRDLHYNDVRYRTVIHPLLLPEHGRVLLSLWMPTREAERLRERIVLGMGGIAILGVLAMALVGYLIARTITAPVEDLVEVTEKVSTGDLRQRATIRSRDEIGTLADSFNDMVEKLEVFEQRLLESEKLATAGQMAAGLAHEIRNPLTSIKMLGQVLQGRIKNQAEDEKTLNALIKEIGRLDRIIQEFINRAMPGELRITEGDINREVTEVITVAEESFTAQDIVVRHSLSDDIPSIPMDREKTRQVLWNLLLNAKEAMQKGGTLIVSTKMANNQFVEISLEDTGHGVATGEAEQLFQPFFTTKPEGVGLGLTMSRKIVEQHGGELLLENRPQGGMQARVLLPIKHT